MPSPKVNLSELTIREKVEFARRLAEAIPAYSIQFPSPPHPQVEVETALRALEVAYDAARLARMMAHRKDELLQEAEASLDSMLQQQIDYVESTSRGDADLLRNIGFGAAANVAAGAVYSEGSGGKEQWW